MIERQTLRAGVLALAGLLATASLSSWAAPPEEPSPSAEDDILGELVVEAKRRPQLVLPKIAVLAPADGERSFLHDLLERDLALSGEFEVVKLERSLDYDDPFDASAFAGTGVEAVLTARVSEDGGGSRVAVRMYLPEVGDLVAWSSARTVDAHEARLAGHRLADGVIGALTGTDGPFASRMVLVRTEARTRVVESIDADGFNLARVSPEGQLVVTATLDREANAYWAASKSNGAYRLYREGQATPLQIEPSGSIYGIAFAPNGRDVAMSIALDDTIQVFGGTLDGDPLVSHSRVDFGLNPAFTRDGRIVYAGTRGSKRRIYVEAKAISPKEVSASTPTICQHPDGPRVVYAVGLDKRTDLVSSKLDGSDLTRLTWDSARNYAPTCSPDGRLIAFFSTRKRDDGPGLYVMRIDGRRAKKVSDVMGDVLAWSRVPVRAKPDPKPEPKPQPETEPETQPEAETEQEPANELPQL